MQYAAIKGSIADPSGSIVPGAQLSIRHTQTGAQRAASTDQAGEYQLEGLAAGDYELYVTVSGFGTAVYGLTLKAGDYLTYKIQLELAQLTQSVSVLGQLSGVNTSDFQVTGSVSRLQIDKLPLNGRNYLELARLEPGVSVASVANPGALGNNYQRVSVAGAQYLETRVTVDSSTVEDRTNGGTALNLSQESVQEVQVATFNFDLATGATGTGAVNIITQRGTNDLHGSVFSYYRDHQLAAYPAVRRDPENPDPFFARRQTGFSMGGPLSKSRFFWFGNLEHANQDGVFAVVNNHPIFSKLDVVQPSPLNSTMFTGRIDAHINDRLTTFLRVSQDNNDSVAPASNSVSMPSNWFTGRTKARQIQGGVTAVASTFIADLRLSHSFLHNTLDAVTTMECRAPQCIGLSGPDILAFDAPSFRMGHHVSVPKTMDNHTWHTVGNLTWHRGTHRFRFGGEWEHLSLNNVQAFFDPPQITLWGPMDLQRSSATRPLFDALPITLRDPQAGPPTWADILQLPLRSFTIGIGNPLQPGPYHHDQASTPDQLRFYFQDSWTPWTRLTLTYGVAALTRTDIFNQDLERPEYLAPLFNGDLRAPHRGTTNLESRTGLAWSPRRDGSTVVRAGAGIYHDDLDFFRPYLERGPLGPAGNGRVMIDGSVTGLSFLSMPTSFMGEDLLPLLPGIRSMLTQKLGNGTDTVTGIEVLKQGDRLFDPNHTTAWALHVNAGIQRRLTPQLTLSADYVLRRFMNFGGFHGVFQLDRNRFNRPRVTGVNPTTGEVSFVRDPVIPLCTAQQAAALAAADRCSTGPINVYDSGAHYSYQGLHVNLEGRLFPHLNLTVAYALARNTGFVEFSSYDDFSTAYGTQPDDRRHRLTLSSIFDLPEYKGRFRPARALLRGWSAALISQVESTPALDTLLTGLDLDGDGISRTLLPGVTQHNSLGRDLSASELRGLVEQYNNSVEERTQRVQNPNGSVSVIRPRTPFNQVINPITLPATFSSGDSFVTQDIRLSRRLDLTETVTASLIAEAFNVFNVANLSGYSNLLNQVNYGQPSARAGQAFGSGGPRAFQFAARLHF